VPFSEEHRGRARDLVSSAILPSEVRLTNKESLPPLRLKETINGFPLPTKSPSFSHFLKEERSHIFSGREKKPFSKGVDLRQGREEQKRLIPPLFRPKRKEERRKIPWAAKKRRKSPLVHTGLFLRRQGKSISLWEKILETGLLGRWLSPRVVYFSFQRIDDLFTVRRLLG